MIFLSLFLDSIHHGQHSNRMLMCRWIRVGVMARGSTGALLLLTISAVAGFRPSHARSLSDDQVCARPDAQSILRNTCSAMLSTIGSPHSIALQVTGHLWHLKPSLDYGQSPGGATIDNHAGWNIANAEGYNPDDNAICAAGLTHCHYTPACFDLQTSAQHCGSCDLSCDFYTQVTHMLMPLHHDVPGDCARVKIQTVAPLRQDHA